MNTPVPIPRVLIPFSAWQQMMAYVVSCPIEVNGFGVVERIGNDIIVREVFILDQVATPGSAEISPDAIAQRMQQMMEQGQSPSNLRFQWHSHVNMQAYFSTTDTSTIDNWSGEWLVSLVLNTSGEYECRLDIFTPFRISYNIVPELVVDIDESLLKLAQDEISEHVRTPRSGFLRRRQPVQPVRSRNFMPTSSPDDLIITRPTTPSMTVTEQ